MGLYTIWFDHMGYDIEEGVEALGGAALQRAGVRGAQLLRMQGGPERHSLSLGKYRKIHMHAYTKIQNTI